MSVHELHESLASVYDADLEEALQLREAIASGALGVGGALTRPAFVIDDNDKASWALRKLAQIERRIAENEEQARLEIERIQQWLEDANGPLRRNREYFESLLTDFHRRRLEEDPSCKTIKLPRGVLRSRNGQRGVEIDDPEAFVEWALKNNREEFVRTKYELDKRWVKTVAIEDGEVLPGVRVTEAERTFKVEVTP